ncbi:hypothetical protein [Tenacibaculum crassostreae]|uniref:hypothetical protein n=1 Tax=Tenacibaculum crassostreae TaxID=502683 RepID=UPI003892E735
MKNLFKNCVLLLFFSVLISCSGSDDSLNENSIKLNGKSFSVISGSILGVSLGDDGHTGITLVSGTSSQVKTLMIDVPTFTKETIANTYSFPEENGVLVLNDFLTRYTYFENNTSVSSGLKSGTVTVKHNGGNNYSVIVDLVMNDDSTFKGTYTNDFQVVFNNNN